MKMLATFDWLQNDFEHPQIDLKKLPAMYFFSGADPKMPIEYKGEQFEVRHETKHNVLLALNSLCSPCILSFVDY
jgi:hypothetical protein